MAVIRPLWRYLNAISVRVMGVVILSGVVTAVLSFAFVSRAMRENEEAELVDAALATVERLHLEASARFALVESQLRAAAYLFDAGRAGEIASLLSPVIVAARLERSGEALDVVHDDADFRLLDQAPRAGRRLVERSILLVHYDVGPVEVEAAIRLGDMVTHSDRQHTWIAPRVDGPDLGALDAPLTIRRERRGDTEWAVAIQPVGSDLVLHHTVSLAPAMAEVRAAISDAIWHAALAAGLLLVLVAFILARTVTRPVRALARALHDHDRDPRAGMPNNEIGELAEAIASSREALARDAELHAANARFAQDAARLQEPDAVLALLQVVLDDTHGATRWRVVSADELDAGEGADHPALDALPAATREVTNPRGERVLVIPLVDDDRPIAVALGHVEASEQERRHVEVMCQIATTAVRGLGLGELAATNEKLAVIGRLSASVAHEMNNPLLYMLTNLTMLEDELQGEQRAMASDAREGAERLAQIVKDMAVMSRGRSESAGPIDLAELIADAVKVARGRARRVSIEVQARAPVIVNCARGPIAQAVLNLLVNAIDAVRGLPDPRVVVAIDATDATGTLTVRDNGPGITLAHQRRLFGAFFTTKAEHGTGLGLYLSRMFARSDSGDLALVDTGAHGTTFRVTLPLAEPALVPQVVDPLPPGLRPRVLIVDDEPVIVRTLERLLGRHADVVATTDPSEGLRAAMTQQFTLVLCDWNMPVMSGAEFLASLRRGHPANASRLVIMTGGDPPTLDGVRVVSKPINRDVMQTLIDLPSWGRSQELRVVD